MKNITEAYGYTIGSLVDISLPPNYEYQKAKILEILEVKETKTIDGRKIECVTHPVVLELKETGEVIDADIKDISCLDDYIPF